MLAVDIAGQRIHIFADKALYIPSTNSLVIADLHVGKAKHFQKHGVAVPSATARDDLDRLNALLNEVACEELIILGDLGHSSYNDEWLDFKRLVDLHPSVRFCLTRGNHDREPKAFYLALGISAVEESYVRGRFLLSHEPRKTAYFNIIGHEHPAVLLSGKGRERLRLPCFYFNEKRGVIPAYTRFSGHHTLRSLEGLRVFPVFKTTIWEVQG